LHCDTLSHRLSGMDALEFVELPEFTRDLHRVAGDEALRALQLELLRNPNAGDVMVGLGGLRKVRMKLPGRGKSGGARVIYLHLPQSGKIVFLFLYTKAKQEDVSPDQRRRLCRLADIVRSAYEKTDAR
jgi:hypothetical protein